ncbi:MAG: helix-turn-helix transcriptional regulator [Erythrobacter sp.]|uniref:winged helix-turn-helix transcriptional regulator n=1 Tax=Erythrobacter sp. TaxID=1042 RepID=UPI001B00527F|nr:helix-turn-helix domain-containing protein [Erythrobacter sp.]MBO6769720.1 helix-turn-helix transcriptional regulator [Erythrobacter sp.]
MDETKQAETAPPVDRVIDVPPSECSLARAIGEIGDAWTLLILREVICGVTRFEKMQEDLGISRAVLSDRLQKSVEFGLLEKVEHREPGQRMRHRYALAPKGRALLPALLALRQWADDFLRDEPSRTVFCDKDMSRVTVLITNEAGEQTSVNDVIATTVDDIDARSG